MSLLEVRDLHVNYGAINVLHGVSLRVEPQEIVTLIGANGAGKSTLLRTLSGLVTARSGTAVFQGVPITQLPAHAIVRLGLSQVPEGRMIFANLSVRENLQMGAYLQKDRAKVEDELGYVFHLFPRLKERYRQEAGTLSGGEQQMLAIGRALMGRPRFLMLDEPSLGIAPLLLKTLFAKIIEVNRERGITILLVEQNANMALEIAHRGYVMETGRITLEDSAAVLRSNPQIRSAYLGG